MGDVIDQKYVEVARIYLGHTETDFYRMVEERKRGDRVTDSNVAALLYLGSNSVPTRFVDDIIRIGRKLSDLEIRALALKKDVEASSNGSNITITVG